VVSLRHHLFLLLFQGWQVHAIMLRSWEMQWGWTSTGYTVCRENLNYMSVVTQTIHTHSNLLVSGVPWLIIAGSGLDDLDLVTLVHLHSSVLLAIIVISLFYTLLSSLLHTQYVSRSLLVAFWQQICHSFTVTSSHTWSLLRKIEFLSCHFCGYQFRNSTRLD
jgi:hypothetical protein